MPSYSPVSLHDKLKNSYEGDYLLPCALLLKNSGQKSLSGGYAKALIPIHQCYAKRPLVTHVIYANHENYNFLNF